MYLITTRITKIDHLSLEEAKREALRIRGKGLRSEIVSDKGAEKYGLHQPMQDLTELKSFSELP